MKTPYCFLVLCFLFLGCGPSQTTTSPNQNSDDGVVEISNDSLDFKLIVFEPDFDSWLVTKPPMESFDLGYLEQKNRIYTMEYNRRALNPRYTDLYPNKINYDPQMDYGLKLNYMLYMYYEFFQEKYKQRL